jgi:hypothetical protein
MIMVDQSKRLSEPLRWTRAGRVGIAIVSACLLLAVVAGGILALDGSTKEGRDCVSVTFASTLGGAQLHACGAQARRVCATPGNFPSIAGELSTACRRAGFRFGVHH